MKIVIISSTHAATGGTELLQQICKQLRDEKLHASMYYTEEYENSNVKMKFESIYNNPYDDQIQGESIAIVPETELDFMWKNKALFSKIFIWWLSVDNYYGSNKLENNWLKKIYHYLKHKRNMIFLKKCSHLVQSQYAYDYLVNDLKINNDKIDYLSDYLNEVYLSEKNINLNKKEDIILYNPKKGSEFTKKIIAKVPEYRWVALEGMTNDQMVEMLTKAKVYIDFGNHPGKDRIPREAAMYYCCVVTGKSGAAKNDKDIPIPPKYKIDDKEENLNQIHDVISESILQYEENIQDFASYRKKIANEKKQFATDVRKNFVENL